MNFFPDSNIKSLRELGGTCELPANQLIQFLTCEHLTKLENAFKCGKYVEGMSKEEFFSALKDSISDEAFNLEGDRVDRDQLYLDFFDLYQIDHRLTWNATLQALINTIPSKDEIKVKLDFLGIHKNELTKRDAIVKVLTIETTAHFCFTVYSKYGRTGIYDADFKELAVYHVIMTREDISRKDDQRRRRNRWITDAIYLQGLKKICVINTARSLVVYDVVGLNHIPLFLILSLPTVPKCIAYKFEGTRLERYIFVGDDSGSIMVFSFVHSKETLFRKKYNDKLSLFYWEELQSEKEYVKINTIKSIHKEIIREIIYCKEDNTLTTCSRDSNASVVKLFLDHKRPTMIYEMPKGTSTMSFSKKLNLLITGSSDGTIRVWNTLVISEAIAVLKEHRTGIKGILLLETQKTFISCAKDGVIKLWCIDNQRCCQTIHLDFPSLNEDGKIVEWAVNCMFLGPRKVTKKISLNSTFGILLDVNSRNECERNSNAEEKVERSLIWVSCCNFLASMSLVFHDSDNPKEFEMPKLEPPPKQNNVFIPSTWLLNEDSFTELMHKVQSPIEHPEKFKDYNYISRNERTDKKERRTNTNQKIAEIDKHKRNMQENVARGAPFLALKLFDIEELGLSDSLAVHDKEEKNIMDKTRNLLVEAKNKDQVFSDISSSRSRSSRSSVVEFEY